MTTPAGGNETLEIRTIEHIPTTERHGRASQLFTIWFGSNIMLLTIATGLLGTAIFGLTVTWAIVALVLAVVLPPIFAIATKGKYYLRRTDDGIDLPMLDAGEK